MVRLATGVEVRRKSQQIEEPGSYSDAYRRPSGRVHSGKSNSVHDTWLFSTSGVVCMLQACELSFMKKANPRRVSSPRVEFVLLFLLLVSDCARLERAH